MFARTTITVTACTNLKWEMKNSCNFKVKTTTNLVVERTIDAILFCSKDICLYSIFKQQ